MDQTFFDRPAVEVAKELLGKFLVVTQPEGRVEARQITEVEAYVGPEDLACDASKGCTLRTQVMFGPPGHFYIYFIYGMYWMLNIVTESQGHAAAVLIRAVEGFDGPGKLTKGLGIDKRFNGLLANRRNKMWIEDRGIKIPSDQIQATPRIGVDYAGPIWSQKEYRFVYRT